MNISEKSVFQVLLAFGDEGLTVKEILLAMNQRMKKKAQLRKALRKLAEKNLCYKTDNHYFLRDPSASVPTEFRKAEKGRRSQKKGSKIQRYPEGIYLNSPGKPIIFSLHNGERYPVAPKEERWLLHGDKIRFSLKQNKSGKEVALPIEVLKNSITLLKGKLERGSRGECFFKPLSPFFPRRFKVLNAPRHVKQDGEEVLLEIANVGESSRIPEGRIDHSITGDTARMAIIEQILSENRIALHFPKKVLRETSRFPATIRLDLSENRKDLRELPFVTIDGTDARDFDDAIFARAENNNYRIWISIADVAAYVERKTEIDKEAMKRGTSTYLPGWAVPMLPPMLSNGLCSLKAGVNRKTLTCEILINPNGKVLSTDIYQSFIRISRRLTYELVDQFFQAGTINGKKGLAQLKELLIISAKISEILEKKRRKRGAIDFQMPDTAFTFDLENRIAGIEKVYQSKAMRLIEQFMLEANEAVARFCEDKKIPIMWRNHPTPVPDKTSRLKQLFWNSGLKISGLREGADFNRALRKCRDNENRELLEYSTLRTMSLAGYWPRREGHFGLAATHYCHFTSPIRRYPDLIVHRGVKAYLNKRQSPSVSERVATDLSEKERQATTAERTTIKFTKMLFMADRIGEVMGVKVSGFHWKGLFVELPAPYIEGFVNYSTITDDTYEYDERKQIVTGLKNDRMIPFGAKLNVMLSGLDKKQFLPEFTWLSWVDENC